MPKSNPMPLLNQFKRLDVRDLIWRGGEPFPEIRKRVDALKLDEGLIIVRRFCRRRSWNY